MVRDNFFSFSLISAMYVPLRYDECDNISKYFRLFWSLTKNERKRGKMTKFGVSSEPHSHLPVYFEYFVFELNLNIM